MLNRGFSTNGGAVCTRLRVASRAQEIALAAILALFISSAATEARAEGIALKSGESVDLGPVYYVSNCKSVLIGTPEVEILEGPAELSLKLREEMVLPRKQNCSSKVHGAILTATAKDIKEPIHAKLTYRVKYKTKDGDRQLANTRDVSLFP